MRTGVLGVIAVGLLTAACGTTQEQRAATGGLTGLGAGAIIGGPIGAAVGAAAGAVGGTMMPEDATSIANNLLGREHQAANTFINGNRTATAAATEGAGTTAYAAPPAPAGQAPAGLVKEAQIRLKQQGLYNGQIDGIEGPQTRNALRAFQQRDDLRQTARLDRETAERLNIEASSAAAADPAANSGSSMPDNSGTNNNTPAPQNAAPTPPAAPSSNTLKQP